MILAEALVVSLFTGFVVLLIVAIYNEIRKENEKKK